MFSQLELQSSSFCFKPHHHHKLHCMTLINMSSRSLLLLTLLSLGIALAVSEGPGTNISAGVTYDHRSLIVRGKRELLFSGSIHYPRSTPDMWPKLLDNAKHGGLNCISTYVFWNIHEPIQGQFNFEGNADLVKFLKLIHKKGLYAILRLGPFIQAEWNHGGLPYWLRDVKDIIFRTDNEPYKFHMEKYVRMIIDKMKAEKLFAGQGGPIILAQIENEYNNIQRAYEEDGMNYVQWAANMAVGLNVGVPWVMCKQKEAPDPVINSCNGRDCGDTFTGPNKPYKPSLWTENWTAQFRVFGDPPSMRSAEAIAYSVARFFSRNGTLANYYMYHGGTNFGRNGASFVTTRYYDEAPLDEYGFQKDPKWSHLRDLHAALRLCRKSLFWGTPTTQSLGTPNQESIVWEAPGQNACAAFLRNNHTRQAVSVVFRGQEYYLPPRSISILPDCKTVVYNTQTIVAQHNSRNFKVSKSANKGFKWEMYRDKIPTTDECPIKAVRPSQLFPLTKDTSDYLWYTTKLDLEWEDLPMRKDIMPVLHVESFGDAMIAFVNGEYVGCGHGEHGKKAFSFKQPISLKVGINHIQLLGMSVGLPDSGAYLEHRMSGISQVTLLGLNTGTLDLTRSGWSHKPGVEGEKVRLYTQGGQHRVQWTKVESKGVAGPSLTWYKAYFDAPEGTNPVVLNLTSMAKGMAWVNGHAIGRYWVSFLSPIGQPTQTEYHVPRSFIKPTDNLLVLFEESGGDPSKIKVLTVNRDTICSYITEFHPPDVKSWKRQQSKILNVVDDNSVKARLKCPNHKVISTVEFASYGNPTGSCGNFIFGNCTVHSTKKIVEQFCLGKTECAVPIDKESFYKPNEEPCQDIPKSLAIQVRCSLKK